MPSTLGMPRGDGSPENPPEHSPAQRAAVTRPVRVLIVDTAIAFGGTLVLTRNLLKHLNPQVVHASMVSACSDGFVSGEFVKNAQVRLLAPKVDYLRLGRWKRAVRQRIPWASLQRTIELLIMAWELLANLPYLARIAYLYCKYDVDIIHANNYTMEPLRAARLLRIPIIYHLHGFVSKRMDGTGRRNFRHVNAFISISRAVTESAVQAGLGRTRIHEIPNFVGYVPDSPAPMPEVNVVGIFGRVTRWKGQKEFLRAMMQVLPRFPTLQVLIVGDASDDSSSYLEECRGIALSSPFADRIEFTGMVTDVVPYYRRCTIVVHASIDPEPFGMVLIEAMAEARPIVASIFGAPAEIIQDGVEGYLVNPNDSKSMAARITELLEDPQLATQMGLNGYRKARTHYDPRAAAKKFEALYVEVANARDLSH